MACVAIKLRDGSTILVNLKPGAKLTAEDIAVLREFYEYLREAKASENE